MTPVPGPGVTTLRPPNLRRSVIDRETGKSRTVWCRDTTSGGLVDDLVTVLILCFIRV